MMCVCVCVLSYAYNQVECVCVKEIAFTVPPSKLDSYVPVHRGIVQALAGQQSPDQQFATRDHTHNEQGNG